MHSGGFELTKLTYTRLEDNLMRHWGDRYMCGLSTLLSWFSATLEAPAFTYFPGDIFVCYILRRVFRAYRLHDRLPTYAKRSMTNKVT